MTWGCGKIFFTLRMRYVKFILNIVPEALMDLITYMFENVIVEPLLRIYQVPQPIPVPVSRSEQGSAKDPSESNSFGCHM